MNRRMQRLDALTVLGFDHHTTCAGISQLCLDTSTLVLHLLQSTVTIVEFAGKSGHIAPHIWIKPTFIHTFPSITWPTSTQKCYHFPHLTIMANYHYNKNPLLRSMSPMNLVYAQVEIRRPRSPALSHCWWLQNERSEAAIQHITVIACLQLKSK